jgi:hypothetical protein
LAYSSKVLPAQIGLLQVGEGVAGGALMVTVAFWPPAMAQPAEVTTQFKVTALPVPAA